MRLLKWGDVLINIKTVAEYVGISTSTVSRVLSGKSYVNEQTRQRVLRAGLQSKGTCKKPENGPHKYHCFDGAQY